MDTISVYDSDNTVDNTVCSIESENEQGHMDDFKVIIYLIWLYGARLLVIFFF